MRFSSSFICVLLLACLFVVPAHSAQAPASSSNPDATRENVAVLKQTALQRLGQIFAAELENEAPRPGRIALYLNVNGRSFRLQRVQVAVNDVVQATHEYNEQEALALLDNTSHRILRTNLEPGTHQLRVTYSGYERGVGYRNNVWTDAVEIEVTAGEAPESYLVGVFPSQLDHSSYASGANGSQEVFRLRDSHEDPRLGFVRYLRRSGKNFAATRELLQLDAAADTPAGYYALLALGFLDFQMREQTLQALQRAQSAPGDQDDYHSAYLRLAELDYRRGEHAQALQWLQRLPPLALNRVNRLTLYDLLGRVYLAQANYIPARRWLKAANEIVDKSVSHNQNFRQTAHIRYNYALALVGAGDTGQGLALLDRLGTEIHFADSTPAIRDQANLALGYHFLRSNQAGSAKPVLQRVSLRGPLANKALLGLGWAELNETGPIQNKTSPGVFGSVWYEGEFTQSLQLSGASSRFARAAVAWHELLGRAPDDAAVLEAAVTLPYVLEQLGRFDDAERLYERALRRYRQARELQIKPESGPGANSQKTSISPEIEEYRDNRRDFLILAGALASVGDASASKALHRVLLFAAAGQNRLTQEKSTAAQPQQRRHLDAYERAAIHGLQRIYDRRARHQTADRVD